MKLKEPDKVVRETVSSEMMDFDEARETRSREFWEEVESLLAIVISERKTKAGEEHAFTKKVYLDYIGKYADALLQGKVFSLPSGLDDESNWELIKFIIAFDTTFEYYPEDDEEEREDYGCGSETDYLDEESTFRYDVIKACDRLALAGAVLAKRIGSDTYGLWRTAMIKLGNHSESVQCKAVDDIVNALELIWADLEVWIAMNPHHVAKKRAAKKRKGKK